MPSFINQNNSQEIQEFLTKVAYQFEGDQSELADGTVNPIPLSGVVGLRSLKSLTVEDNPYYMVRNELLPKFDDYGNFQGLYLYEDHGDHGKLVKIGTSQEDFMNFITNTEWIIDANLTANE